MERTWFVVADQSQASLYRVGGTKMEPVLEEVDVLDHPQAREHLDPSESGSKFSPFDPSNRSAEKEKRFVRQLVARLKQEQQRGEFRELYIAAPAGFVGKIRGMYTHALSRAVQREIVGDFTREDVHTLTARIRKKRWLS